MKPQQRTWFSVTLLLSLIAAGFSSVAQTIFSANVSAQKIGVQDQLQVDYTIENATDLRSLPRPDFKDFIVVGGPYQQQSSNVSIIGNKMVQSERYTHSYILQPKKTGTLTIPPAIARDGSGHQFESNSISVQVVQGSVVQQRQQRQNADPFADPYGDDPFAAIMQQQQRAMQAMMQRRQQAMRQQQPRQQEAAPDVTDMEDVYKNIFIKVDVDKTKAHVGEQVTATYKLYARIPMSVGISKLPSLNGFWTQDFLLPDQRNLKPVEETVDGKKYQVFVLKKSALFPQQEGTLSLDPAEASGTARIIQQVRQRGNPFDNDPFFSAFGSMMMSDPFFNDDMFGNLAYKDVPIKIKSAPVKIQVNPVPTSGKPADYGGAVGQFTLNSKLDKEQVTTDDAITYTLTIAGTGNFKLIQAPKLALPNGLTTYDPQVIDTITGRSTTISGSKIITYTISPNTPGVYTIPAVPFSYYNTATNSYTTLYTKPVRIDVDRGKNYKPEIAQKRGISDIHPCAAAPLKKFESVQKPMFFTAGYWSMYALPMLAFVGLLAWRRKDEELNKDIVKLKNRRANKVALKRLQTAEAFLNKGSVQPFYEEVSKAIWLYLSDKLNIPLSSLSRERAHEVLHSRKVTPGLVEQVERVIQNCETALYMPGADSSQQMQRTFTDAVDIISQLEQSL